MFQRLGKGAAKAGQTISGVVICENGVRISSETLWNSSGKESIDVENSKSGVRSRQIHYRDENNKRYRYDIDVGNFIGFSNSENAELLSNPKVMSAINKAKTQYLGEK
jgi:hypothetical protein